MNMANLIETEEERMLAGAARRFLDDLAPVSHLRQMRDRMQTHDPDLWYQMSAMGWASRSDLIRSTSAANACSTSSSDSG